MKAKATSAFEVVIGLEVHVQLKTKSKMFCRCDNGDNQAPNTAICPICTGQPGTLPLPNKQAIDWAVMAALALGCSINQESKFDRKHYFYPDLPKGYQISQYDKPFGYAGSLTLPVDGQTKTFRIHRLHLEEDAGKLLHQGNQTLIDLNRAGTPLMEIVSEPDFRTAAEAKAYLQELRLIMRYLGVSDADMEKGHLRCDANISLRPVGDEKLYPKTEIKNLNSFKAVERALQFEIERQRGLWEDKKAPKLQSTRGWDEGAQKTVEQRTKEEAADYRYFPEPDIPPIITSDEQLITLKDTSPELPEAWRLLFTSTFGLTSDQADGLVQNEELAKFFKEVVSKYQKELQEKQGIEAADKFWKEHGNTNSQFIANFLIHRIPQEHRANFGLPPPDDLARLLILAKNETITIQSATEVYKKMVETRTGGVELVTQMGKEIMQDQTVIQQAVDQAIEANAKVVAEIHAGKTAGLQFLVGQVMKATKGKANPKVVQELLAKALSL